MASADEATGDCVASLGLMVGLAENEVCVGIFGVQFPSKKVLRTIQRMENRGAEQCILLQDDRYERDYHLYSENPFFTR